MTIGRRDVETIITTHRMDPSRRELYVEGRRDNAFLTWVVGNDVGKDVQIVEIDEVEGPSNSAGNNRARLIHFAVRIDGQPADILCFADADWDRLFGRAVPRNLILSDDRDLEGYVTRVDCVEKLLRLALNNIECDPEVLHRNICSVGRAAGMVRITSEKHQYRLPFQTTDLKRCLNVTNLTTSLDTVRWKTTLFQNADISLAELELFDSRLAEMTSELANNPDRELVHGKDYMDILQKVLLSCRVKGPQPSTRALWTAFERSMVSEYSNLSAVVRYLERQVA